MKFDPIAVNRMYGHTDDCAFGTKNSGFCTCGKGFPSLSKKKRVEAQKKAAK